MSDDLFMRHAIGLADRAVGRTAENPPVGCVIVKDGIIVGRGSTADFGRPHAEVLALKQADDLARGSTAYVTLEPCSHTGKTGPCADALIKAGITRVVVATVDPDPRVSGAGLHKLEAAGLEVVVGCCETLAEPALSGFFSRVVRGRPFVTLKIATSLDGSIALANGESQWITGDASRAHAHKERARHDAFLVGLGTVLADDPSLTCRLPGLEHFSPRSVILDRTLETPRSARLLTSNRNPLIIASESANAASHNAHAEVIGISDPDDLDAVLGLLADRGVNRLLIEGGAGISTRFLKGGYVDRILHYQAAKILGGDSLSAIRALGLSKLEDAPIFTATSSRRLGADRLTIYSNVEAE